MVRIELKGIAKATAKGRTYYYAWRAAHAFGANGGTPEFVASYNEAIESRRSPDRSRFKALLTAYKASAEYKKLAELTRKNWSSWLDRIADYFGSFGLLNSTGRKRFGRSSGLGATSGPELHVPLIMGCKFYPASSLMPLTHWVRLQATPATASSDSIKPIARRLFGPIPILQPSSKPVPRSLPRS